MNDDDDSDDDRDDDDNDNDSDIDYCDDDVVSRTEVIGADI